MKKRKFDLEKAGVAIAAVTSHTVEKFFKVIITPLDVKSPKPDPESIGDFWYNY